MHYLASFYVNVDGFCINNYCPYYPETVYATDDQRHVSMHALIIPIAWFHKHSSEQSRYLAEDWKPSFHF